MPLRLIAIREQLLGIVARSPAASEKGIAAAFDAAGLGLAEFKKAGLLDWEGGEPCLTERGYRFLAVLLEPTLLGHMMQLANSLDEFSLPVLVQKGIDIGRSLSTFQGVKEGPAPGDRVEFGQS